MDSLTTTPTYFGLVRDINDALILFQLAVDGELKLVQQRLSEEDRNRLIKSGNIFIFKESSGIRRWTDSVSWSPSRIVGNFLVYREVKKDESGHRRDISKNRSRSIGYRDRERSRSPKRPELCRMVTKRPDPALVGSLADSEHFKEGGLVKRTITAKFKNDTYHLVSYYTLEDAEDCRLPQISHNPNYTGLEIHQDLINSPSFRVTLNGCMNPMVEGYEKQPQPLEFYGNYGRTTQSSYPPAQPALMPSYLPNVSPQRHHQPRYVDSLPHGTGPYGTVPGIPWRSGNRPLSETCSPTRSQQMASHPVWPSHPTPTDPSPRSGRDVRLSDSYSPVQGSYPTSVPEYYDNIDHSLGYNRPSSMTLSTPPNPPAMFGRNNYNTPVYDPAKKSGEYARSYYDGNIKDDSFGGRLYDNEEKPLR